MILHVLCGVNQNLFSQIPIFNRFTKFLHFWPNNVISSVELAQAVVDAGAVPLLVLCIQEPELSLKRIAASALSDICKHSPELAQTVVDAGAIAHLAQMILNPDAKLKVEWLFLYVLYIVPSDMQGCNLSFCKVANTPFHIQRDSFILISMEMISEGCVWLS